MSEALQRAREFEEKHLQDVSEEKRPKFHMTGAVGWINDPNGFSIYKKEYHLFFQYHPYSTHWGPMHWGHVKTKDFIKWERLPIALAPDEDYDRNGCFSGSAIELPDGQQLLIYTGVRIAQQEDGQSQVFQTQCIAVGDGINYKKYEANPVISSADIPNGGSTEDFRDPKIWREDGKYYLVVGNRSTEGSGVILLYESLDGKAWEYKGNVASCHNQYGSMWECPDLFLLDGKRVLLTSPQEMMAKGLEFHAGNGSLCLIGEFDKEKYHLNREYVQAIDYGIDFYAPQTLETKDGRRVMIAWMQNWETSNAQPRNLYYFGEMTIPRELHVKNGRLYQLPVRELENYYDETVTYTDVTVDREISLCGIEGRVLDMTIKIRPANMKAMYTWFQVCIAKEGEMETVIRFQPKNNVIRVDRTGCGYPYDIVNVREFMVDSVQGELKLRIILDRHSMELFANDGEQAASFMIYTKQSAQSICFAAEGAVSMDVEKHGLKFD